MRSVYANSLWYRLPTFRDKGRFSLASRGGKGCVPSSEGLGYPVLQGFLGGAVVKNLPANAGDTHSIPGSGRSPGEGNGNPLQYSCLENPMDRGAWWATVHRVQRVGHH